MNIILPLALATTLLFSAEIKAQVPTTPRLAPSFGTQVCVALFI